MTSKFIKSIFISILISSGLNASENLKIKNNTQALQGSWQLIKLNKDKLSDSKNILINFNKDKNNVNGNLSCNNFFGTYYMDNKGNLSIKNIATTRMLCDENSMKIENNLLNKFKEIVFYEKYKDSNNEYIKLRDNNSKEIMLLKKVVNEFVAI